MSAASYTIGRSYLSPDGMVGWPAGKRLFVGRPSVIDDGLYLVYLVEHKTRGLLAAGNGLSLSQLSANAHLCRLPSSPGSHSPDTVNSYERYRTNDFLRRSLSALCDGDEAVAPT